MGVSSSDLKNANMYNLYNYWLKIKILLNFKSLKLFSSFVIKIPDYSFNVLSGLLNILKLKKNFIRCYNTEFQFLFWQFLVHLLKKISVRIIILWKEKYHFKDRIELLKIKFSYLNLIQYY